MKPSLLEQHKRIKELREVRDELTRIHNEQLRAIANEIYELGRQSHLQAMDMETRQVAIAEAVIYVVGQYTGEGEQASTVTAAIEDVVNNTKRLKNQYFGCKNYGHFYNQGSAHPYGYGPKHGHIVLEIGLYPHFRKRDLSEEEASAVIYYLTNLKRIQSFKGAE